MDLTKIPIGLGTMGILNKEIILKALLAGYRLIDTAKVYNNETIIGSAITDYLSHVHHSRDDFILQTKIWCDDIENETVTLAVHKAIAKLKVSYLDIVLIHRPTLNFHKTIKAYEDLLICQREGLIKMIGVSNFDNEMINILYSHTGVYPAINQIEFHCQNQRWDRVQFCQNNNILVQGYGALRNCLKYQPLIEYAKDYKCTVPQLILSWMNYYNIQPIVSSTNIDHLYENLNYQKLKVRKAMIKELSQLNIYDNNYPESFDAY